MTYRRFSDKKGVGWEVWQITPAEVDGRRLERRNMAERRRIARQPAVERRTRDRRVSESTGYVRVSNGFENGWLCFSTVEETRRLAPIPPRWLEAPPEQLEMWAGLATKAWKCSTAL